MPRLDPVSPKHGDSRALAGFARVEDYAAASNPVLGTLMWHPELAEHYMPFSDYVKNRGRLTADQRRLVILRTAWNSGADYQWVAHSRYAREAGVAEEDLVRISEGPDASGWNELEGALLRAADELHATRNITDDTWACLATSLDPPRLIELLMLVGNYEMIAMVMNSVGILPDDPAPALPGNQFRAPASPA